MPAKYLVGAAVAAIVALPVAAQTTEYYVVHDATTQRCTIVEQKPPTTSVVQVGPLAFKSRTEAETGMKTIKVCETQ